MIIEANKPQEVALRTLDYGEVFEKDGEFYLNFPPITDHSDDSYNAIHLATGYLEHFHHTTLVVPHPKAKLIIED